MNQTPSFVAPARAQSASHLSEQAQQPTFYELGVDRAILASLERRGLTIAFPIQSLVIPDALDGHDILARSRTGSGKTLAFAIPIIQRLGHRGKRPRALILVPTRELATQVADEITTLFKPSMFSVATIYGGVSQGRQASRAANADVLVATPGRFLDLCQQRLLDLREIEVCVLDEADRMLDMGFLPDVKRILAMLPESPQMMLFSATLDGEIGNLAQKFTHDPIRHEIIDDRPVVEEADHRFVAVAHEDRIALLCDELEADRGRTIVFVRTKRGADRLAKTLVRSGINAHALHGDMGQGAREKALARFAKSQGDVLVATDVAARGIDLEGITHVVNFDLPGDEKAYVHRVGRTARAGQTGIGITFVMPEQRADVRMIASKLSLGAELEAAGISAHAPRPSGPGNRSGRPGSRSRRSAPRRGRR